MAEDLARLLGAARAIWVKSRRQNASLGRPRRGGSRQGVVG